MLVSLSYNYWSSTRRAVLSLPTRRSSDLQWRGVGGTRILKELDPISREIVGFRLQFMRSLDRPIYVDNRPHPPAFAPHSWSGFSTAQWEGHTLKVTTTHLKDGFLKRGGPQTSDMLTITEDRKSVV